jgi:ElaB/YqjD/DUF883 family membrane-anchored ribosome-binding protein
MKKEEDDFGFTLVTENELKEYERQIEKQLIEVQSSAQIKMEGLKKLVMPLLENLMKDEEKTYIYWPNRVDRIKAFLQKIDKYIQDNK